MISRTPVFLSTIFFSLVFISCGSAQSPQKTIAEISGKTITYQEWKEEEKTNIRLLPKYGNRPKTEKQKVADNELIKSYAEQYGTRRKGSEVLISQGFDYLYRGDIKTAMYRINQAWLLDSSNTDNYWGFGAVYFSLKQHKLALEQYEEGLSADPKNSKIITDKATIFMAEHQQINDVNKLKRAIALLEQSYRLDSKNQNTLFKLSVCYFLNNDCIRAKNYYNECMGLGGKPITKEYTMALNEKCKS